MAYEPSLSFVNSVRYHTYRNKVLPRFLSIDSLGKFCFDEGKKFTEEDIKVAFMSHMNIFKIDKDMPVTLKASLSCTSTQAYDLYQFFQSVSFCQ